MGIEVGALSLALCSLSSKDRDMRSAGYHVLARLTTALEAAKLSQEKQVWLHVISILRLGVVTNNLTKAGRVSSIITQHLSRCVDVLLTPLSPLYKTATRHGLLTWCQGVLTRERLDIAMVRKLLTITKRMIETCSRIDERKLRTAEAENSDEGKESKRLLLPTLEVPFSSLLSKFSRIADSRVQFEMKSDVENLQSLLISKR